MDITNAVNRVDVTFVIQDGPLCNGDYVYVLWRIEGTFSQSLNFRGYPVDYHSLKLAIEVD